MHSCSACNTLKLGRCLSSQCVCQAHLFSLAPWPTWWLMVSSNGGLLTVHLQAEQISQIDVVCQRKKGK